MLNEIRGRTLPVWDLLIRFIKKSHWISRTEIFMVDSDLHEKDCKSDLNTDLDLLLQIWNDNNTMKNLYERDSCIQCGFNIWSAFEENQMRAFDLCSPVEVWFLIQLREAQKLCRCRSECFFCQSKCTLHFLKVKIWNLALLCGSPQCYKVTLTV